MIVESKPNYLPSIDHSPFKDLVPLANPVGDLGRGGYFPNRSLEETVVIANTSPNKLLSYGIDNPMPMRCVEAPLAVERNGLAHEIYQEGMERIMTAEALPKTGKIDEDLATKHNFSFLQLAGIKMGKTRVANVSEGLTWDRQTTLEEVAKKILLGIGGEYIVRTSRYGYKWVAFIETDRDASAFYSRFINAPANIWREELPGNIADIQSDIQHKRELDQGTRQYFMDTFNGDNQGELKQAYQKDDKRLFSWDSQTTEEDLGALDADGVFMSMTELALNEHTDENTKAMLLDMVNFLKGASGRNRFWIEFNYDSDAVCCNASTNSQYQGGVSSIVKKVLSTPTIVIASSENKQTKPSYGGVYYYENNSNWCNKHSKSKTECDCVSNESKKSN